MKADHNGHGGGPGEEHSTGGSGGPRAKSIEANYEVNDVELRGIIVFLVGLTVMTVAVYLLMLGMFKLLNNREAEQETGKPRPVLALSEKERLPPEPRLQSAPGFAQQLGKEIGAKGDEAGAESERPKERTWELDQLRLKWNEDLQQGPKDQNGQPSGISIDEAMKRILEGNSLPDRSSAPAMGPGEAYSIELPTAASSARMTEQRKQ
jgi:hypothetical protein